MTHAFYLQQTRDWHLEGQGGGVDSVAQGSAWTTRGESVFVIERFQISKAQTQNGITGEPPAPSLFISVALEHPPLDEHRERRLMG